MEFYQVSERKRVISNVESSQHDLFVADSISSLI